MSLAPQELENNASKYASEAIKFDSQGARGMAITNYQKAIDSLVKLLQLYPSSKLNELYKERCNSYHSRIKSLQESHGVEPAVDPEATPSEQKASVQRQDDENDFEELIMKEKPTSAGMRLLVWRMQKVHYVNLLYIQLKDQTCFHWAGQKECCFMAPLEQAKQC